MSARDVQHHLKQVYGTESSHETISNITDQVMTEARAWQARPAAYQGVNPSTPLPSLIRVPTTRSAHHREVVVIIGAIVVTAVVLICACTVTVLRRRGRARG